MKDKDLLVVIAGMLRKQDQQAETLNLHTQILQHHTQILTNQTQLLEKTNETLSSFMEVSVKQFDEQHRFNEQFLELNQKMADRLERIEKKL
ncbi:MAG TPA: hypothetical protein VF602_04440 [Pedobacter sp.]|jgi:hypothetical protein